MSEQTLTTTATTPASVSPAAPVAAYLASLAAGPSRDSTRSRLDIIARLMGHADAGAVDWRTLNAAAVQAVVSATPGAPATRNKTLAVLKGVARAAWRMGVLDTDILQRIDDVQGAKGSRLAAGRDVAHDERARLLAATKADATPAGLRDAAVLAMAMQTGMRRAELAGLSMAHIVVDKGDELAVQFVGKGNKERECYVFNGALRALRAWLAVRGMAPGAVFCVIGKGGHIQHARHMSTTALHKRLTLRAAAAGVADVNWHDFRRTYAGDLLDSGADISTVAQLLGHSSVTTTQRYDRRPAATRRAAAARVSVPY